MISSTAIPISILIAAVLTGGTSAPAQKLHFTEGASYHVQIDEMLKLTQQMPQVDSALVEPSMRFSTYHFTENIQKVNADGSALVAATLDSFVTKIFVGKIEDRNEYFRFNSNNEYDVANRLHDPRALPRAQYLGQTLTYTVESNGLIRNFENLSSFQSATISRSFDYDLMHAMMALSDSLRIGQLLEEGNGALAAIESGGRILLPYTVTEIHATKQMQAKKTDKHISYTAEFTHPPEKIDYLEGIAFPIVITSFSGGSFGTVDLGSGVVVKSSETDSATMELHLDTEVIHNDILRTLSVLRTENKVLRGVEMKIRPLPTDSTNTTSKPKGYTAPPPDSKSRQSEPNTSEPKK